MTRCTCTLRETISLFILKWRAHKDNHFSKPISVLIFNMSINSLIDTCISCKLNRPSNNLRIISLWTLLYLINQRFHILSYRSQSASPRLFASLINLLIKFYQHLTSGQWPSYAHFGDHIAPRVILTSKGWITIRFGREQEYFFFLKNPLAIIMVSFKSF